MKPDELKQEQVALYGAGEYYALSAVLAPAAQELVDAVGIERGTRVLDVGAGDGNAALAAAARGAAVVATDLSPLQVDRGRARTSAAGAVVDWVVADAEDLPFRKKSFDAVVSSFGAVFAPDPSAAAGELCRVCRAGGLVGLTAWPPDALMGRLAAAVRERVPEFPDVEHGWGREATARQILQPYADVTRCKRLRLAWDPAARGAAGASDCAAAYTSARLPADEISEIRQRVAAPFMQPDGTLRADYLLVVARVR